MGLSQRLGLPTLDRFQRAMLALAAAIMIYQFMIPPVIGVFDNGDWSKMMGPLGLEHTGTTVEENHDNFTLKLRFGPVWQGGNNFLVSGRITAVVAYAIGKVVSKDGLFDMRVVGSLHALLVLLGLALIMSATAVLDPLPRRVIAALLVFVFTDVGYIAFFNSFYSQAESLCFLLITTGFVGLIIVNEKWRWGLYLGFVVSATLFCVSKPQEAPQSLLLGALAIVFMQLRNRPRARAAGLLAAVFIVATTFNCFQFATKANRPAAIYNAVFHELLVSSPDPAADLIALGLDPALVRYRGTHAFKQDTPIADPVFQAAFFDRITQTSVSLFYLKHPSRFWWLLKGRSARAFTLVSHYGNFERSVGLPQMSRSTAFKLWSDLKRRVLPGSIWMVLILFLGNIAAAIFAWRRLEPSLMVGLLLLNLMAIGAFLVCALADGRLDIVRQLYSFNAMTDLILIADVAWLVYTVQAYRLKHPIHIGIAR